MHGDGPNNPLHGVKLDSMLAALVEDRGWEVLADETGVRFFYSSPNHKSGLKFLRTTPWARAKVEQLYLEMVLWKDS